MTVASKKKAPTVVQLAKRVDELEKRLLSTQEQASQNEGRLQLLITAVLSTIRWAYALCKARGDQKRMDNFKMLGESLNEALADIEPDF